jgi:hypothetical protein
MCLYSFTVCNTRPGRAPTVRRLWPAHWQCSHRTGVGSHFFHQSGNGVSSLTSCVTAMTGRQASAASMAGLFCLAVLTPLTLLVLGTFGVGALSPWHFVYFKATFAAVEGALVTPFLALWAVSEAPAGPLVGRL